MQRIECSFGLLEYKTLSIPTMGASNGDPHEAPIRLVETLINEDINHHV